MKFIKLKLFALIAITLLFSSISFADINKMTIEEVNSADTNTTAILSGSIKEIKKSDSFILQDSTGTVLARLIFTPQEISDLNKKYPNLLGATVVVEGNITKGVFRPTVFKIDKMQVIKVINNQDPFSDAVNQAKFDETVKEAKSQTQ